MVVINKHTIGLDYPAYIIAEMSANHKQSLDFAREHIHAAAEAGADAIKTQAFTPDSMTLDLDQPGFRTRKESHWPNRKLYDLYKEAAMPYDWHEKLKEEADSTGIDYLSSPFDREAVDLLDAIDIPAFKIASFEITDIPLIQYVAGKGKPVILSTGIAETGDIELALKTIRDQQNEQIILLKCNSTYPTPLQDVNLQHIAMFREKYQVETGLSDHTESVTVPAFAVMMGARVIEKHFVVDHKSNTLDSDFSLDAQQLEKMIQYIREAEKSLGKKEYELTDDMQQARTMARSLYVVKPVKKGEILTFENIKSIRPGYGLHPGHLSEIIGCRARQDLETGTPLSFEHIERD